MQTSLITHFYNEELLMEQWIKHHLPFFDRAVLINHASTDSSLEIARSLIPKDWKIIDTKLPDFNATLVDQEVMEVEKTLPGWKMTLNTTEFLFCPDFRERLIRVPKDILALGCRPVSIIDTEPGLPILDPIWKNRTTGFYNYGEGHPVKRHWRFVHRGEQGLYTVGRHDTYLTKTHDVEFLHLHLMYSPWPECKPRKLQIQNRIPECDKVGLLGVQHITDWTQLDGSWREFRTLAKDMLLDPVFKRCYDELLKQRTTAPGGPSVTSENQFLKLYENLKQDLDHIDNPGE